MVRTVRYLVLLFILTLFVAEGYGIPAQLLQMPAEPDSAIANIVSRVSEYPIMLNISLLQDFGSRRWDLSNRDSVSGWIYEKFLEMGVKEVQFDSFTYSNTVQKNVVATIPGHIRPKSVIIVGAHFDSQNPAHPTQAPGADDNASGTSAVLEMARVLQSLNYQPAVTLKFIAFAAEEAGLIGSSHYAQLARNSGTDIKVMMNFDMIGYRNTAQTDRDFYLVTYPGSEIFSSFEGTMAAVYTSLHPVYTSSYLNQSDSYPFYVQGYNATFAIERDFSPYYHSVDDQYQYLDMGYAREITQTGLASMLTLDQIPAAVSGLDVRDRGDGMTLVLNIDHIVPPDFQSYTIYLRNNFGVNETIRVDHSEHIEIGGLVNETTYTIGVSVTDLVGLESPVVDRTGIPRVIPLSPSGLTALAVQQGVQLEWMPNKEMDIAGYNVYRRTSGEQQDVFIRYIPFPQTGLIDPTPFLGRLTYRISAIDSALHESELSDTVQVQYLLYADEPSSQPKEFRLTQNFPNPFNPVTTIEYSIPRETFVSLRVYDITGRTLAQLVYGVQTRGKYSVEWNGDNLPSGLYFYKIETPFFTETKKMLLIR